MGGPHSHKDRRKGATHGGPRPPAPGQRHRIGADWVSVAPCWYVTSTMSTGTIAACAMEGVGAAMEGYPRPSTIARSSIRRFKDRSICLPAWRQERSAPQRMNGRPCPTALCGMSGTDVTVGLLRGLQRFGDGRRVARPVDNRGRCGFWQRESGGRRCKALPRTQPA